MEKKFSKELETYFKYRDEILSIVPINSEDSVKKYQDILKRYYGIDVTRLTGQSVNK